MPNRLAGRPNRLRQVERHYQRKDNLGVNRQQEMIVPRHRTHYRSSDGLADYLFSFEEQPNGTWRAYIEDQPSYRDRAIDGHSTHRLSNEDRKFVCWTEPLRSLDEAKKVAALWADKTQQYIRTGSSF